VPELPEVESVRLSLLPHVRGCAVSAVEVRRRGVVSVTTPRGASRRLGPRDSDALLLRAARIETIERRGKQLAVLSGRSAADRVLVIQLGMSGQLFCLSPGAHFPNATHVHVVWRLDSGARLVFRDPRRFGGVCALSNPAALAARWESLGPDALSIEAEDLQPRLARTKRAIKSALLDQRVLAGVGNIYADESLFRAGISPTARASALKRPVVERLARCIREVLGEAVAAGGSSLSDGTYIDANGNPGNFQTTHNVYGRTGQTCRVCGAALRSMLINNRTTVWCPGCQRGR
jgi:formamidopyrimidine-DNA glycosylase